jgi:peptide/nickel transport system ATP-binding protein
LPAAPVLQVDRLTVGFPAGGRMALAANQVSFQVEAGSTMGLVGESGCGKSVTLRALCGLVPRPGRVLGGAARFGEVDLARAPADVLRSVRGREIAMVFQDPAASLDPVHSVGHQLRETLRVTGGMNRRDARLEAVSLLERVGIAEPARRVRSYPHELSGGMQQRVMIAMAIAGKPRLLLADEPTTALDVSTQEQVLDLLVDLQRESGMAMILVSHDLGVIRERCDHFAVMYAGFVVERATRAEAEAGPRHPYTRGLLAAMPSLGSSGGPTAIPGQPPEIDRLEPGCPFRPRCAFARDACAEIDMSAEAATDCACPFARAGDLARPHRVEGVA